MELLNDSENDYVGTGWMISDGLMIINRHVALTFARREAGFFFFRNNPRGEKLHAQIDFLQEYENPAAFEVPIDEIVFIEDDPEYLPDMALFRVGRVDNLPPPLELSDRVPRFRGDVAVIGYPAKDHRNDAFVMRDIFKDIYGVKRLSPGQIAGVRQDGMIVEHDCSTLGGNSGSALIDLDSGKVAGLHFSGSFGVSNYAVTAQAIRQKIAQLGPLRITIGLPASDMAPIVSHDERSRSKPDGSSAGSPKAVGNCGSSDGAGFDENFLGKLVPLPDVSAVQRCVAPVRGNSDGVLNYTHYSAVIHRERRFAMFTGWKWDNRT